MPMNIDQMIQLVFVQFCQRKRGFVYRFLSFKINGQSLIYAVIIGCGGLPIVGFCDFRFISRGIGDLNDLNRCWLFENDGTIDIQVKTVGLVQVIFQRHATTRFGGLLVAVAIRLPMVVAVALTALFALTHGVAHGLELPALTSPWGYAAGFVVATAALHASGYALVRLLPHAAAPLVRLLGAASALTGAWLLAG